jgi:hypothetical protein
LRGSALSSKLIAMLHLRKITPCGAGIVSARDQAKTGYSSVTGRGRIRG